jgi:hypothetical protein
MEVQKGEPQNGYLRDQVITPGWMASTALRVAKVMESAQKCPRLHTGKCETIPTWGENTWGCAGAEGLLGFGQVGNLPHGAAEGVKLRSKPILVNASSSFKQSPKVEKIWSAPRQVEDLSHGKNTLKRRSNPILVLPFVNTAPALTLGLWHTSAAAGLSEK